MKKMLKPNCYIVYILICILLSYNCYSKKQSPLIPTQYPKLPSTPTYPDSFHEVISKIDSDSVYSLIIDDLIISGTPNASGLVAQNKSGWQHCRFQMAVGLFLAVNIVRGKENEVDQGLYAIEKAYEYQQGDGSLLDNVGAGIDDNLSGATFFLCEASFALLVLKNSQYATTFNDRLSDLLPKIESHMQWLINEPNWPLLIDDANDGKYVNRLLFEGCACFFSGELLKNNSFIQEGNQLIERSLQKQDTAGWFLETGKYDVEHNPLPEPVPGGDSSYQAVSLTRLFQYFCINHDQSIINAFNSGSLWELSKISIDGIVDTSENTRVPNEGKDVDYPDVILALLYYGIRNNNSETLNKAIAVYNNVK